LKKMELIKLSPRLDAIARMVPPGARLADVGTDHGYLPIRLLQEGRIRSAVATDIRPGPLSRAESNARAYNVHGMRCVLCDGLAALSGEDADTIVIAGMGGETIAGILQRAPWTKNGHRLLLQPMSRPEILRRFLAESGCRIFEEHLAEDNGRVYSILRAGGGRAEVYSEAELYTGLYEHISKDSLFIPFIKDLKARLSAAAEGLSHSEKGDPTRLSQLRLILDQLEEMREKHDKGF